MSDQINLDIEAAVVEAVLFLESEPLDSQAISRISGLAREIVETVLPEIRDRFSSKEHGIELIQISGGWTFCPKKKLWESLRERYGKKNEGKLSKAALETLSVIAYSQPVTRAEIEAVRGVQVDNMVRLLLDRFLIKETGKKDAPGKPVQYGTTKEFLKFFRLNSIAELPKLNEEDRERFELNENES